VADAEPVVTVPVIAPLTMRTRIAGCKRLEFDWIFNAVSKESIMKDQRLDPEEIGKQLATESVETTVGKVEAYCACERQRIELANQPSILALRAEGGLLMDERRELEDRLRHAPPAADFRTRKRKAVYYWTVAGLLATTGIASTVLALDPFRLGWKGYLYCFGITVVSPFVIENMLRAWNVEKFLKYLATAASLAALTSLMCLAVIRGSLLTQQLQSANEPTIVDDTQPTAPTPENRFYENTALYLLIAMLMAAAAMEIGAGLALFEAWKMSSNSSEDWQALRERLSAIHERLLGLTFELKRLELEGDVFVARFWRNFYDAMLKHTLRSAMTKLLVVLAASVLCGQARAADQEALSIVIALDLTKSVAVEGPTKKTEFHSNVDAITKLLSEIPAGSRIEIVGITDKTFTEPYVLLSAQVPNDAGYFGEKLTSAHRQLVNAWVARTRQLQPTFASSDILGAFSLAADIFQNNSGAQRKVLAIFSDMRQHTAELDLETVVPAFAVTGRQIPVPDLSGVDVYPLGVDGSGRSAKYWNELKDFWSDYMQAIKARLQSYSGLRELRVTP